MIQTLTFTAREQDVMLKSVLELASQGTQFTFRAATQREPAFEWSLSWQEPEHPQTQAA